MDYNFQTWKNDMDSLARGYDIFNIMNLEDSIRTNDISVVESFLDINSHNKINYNDIGLRYSVDYEKPLIICYFIEKCDEEEIRKIMNKNKNCYSIISVCDALVEKGIV